MANPEKLPSPSSTSRTTPLDGLFKLIATIKRQHAITIHRLETIEKKLQGEKRDGG